MNINKLCKDSHKTAREKGWYPKEGRNIGELIALIHSELSEALEHARNKDHKLNEILYSDLNGVLSKKKTDTYTKPDGFAIEIADVIIRIADMCGYLDIDLEKAIKIKMAYNKTRKNKHGGKIF